MAPARPGWDIPAAGRAAAGGWPGRPARGLAPASPQGLPAAVARHALCAGSTPLQLGIQQSNTVPNRQLRFSMQSYATAQNSTQHRKVLQSTAKHNNTKHCKILQSTALHCTALESKALQSTALQSTVLNAQHYKAKQTKHCKAKQT